jgi:RNA polymerase sigma-70 factor (ECF subfamily)
MTNRTVDLEIDLEPFRAYLTILARAQLGRDLRSKLDSADLVQQTLLRACRRREDFRGEGGPQLRAWLRKILANVVIDALRKFGEVGGGGRERSLEDSAQRLEGLLKDSGSSPSHKADRKERILLLADALARLPDDQRLAVEMRHIQGKSLDEIAGQMERSVPAVAGLLRRGLKALRSELAELA